MASLPLSLGDACALTFAYHVAQKHLHHFGILGQAEENIGGKIISSTTRWTRFASDHLRFELRHLASRCR